MELPVGFRDIYFNETRLCPHLDGEFQNWLDNVPDVVRQRVVTTPTSNERYALVEFYDSTGGDDWTDNDGWDSDSEVGDWYGVTVDADDSLVRRARGCPDNGSGGSAAARVIANLRETGDPRPGRQRHRRRGSSHRTHVRWTRWTPSASAATGRWKDRFPST